MKTFKITNTLSNKKEDFKPLKAPEVKMYVCGITPYDYPHIGHGRVYVIFDVLYRLLRFMNYEVTYCRNFTDIDDKLITKALKEYGDEQKFATVANTYIDAFKEDVGALNCLPPDFQPKVTDNIPEIITFIQDLIARNKAYVTDGNVWYRINSFPEYGKLSKQDIDELQVGARVQANEEKENPLDFALWKSEPEGTYWQSPWGYGRPGWHIECSALAKTFLGTQIDIHGGGMDLIFPHHENEVAQTEGLTGLQFARYWMHNAFVRINKEKMSKSLGNFFTLRDVFARFDPMVIRFMILNHHYRAPLDFAFEDVEVAQKSYQRLCHFFTHYDCTKTTPEDVNKSEVAQKMLAFLCDDLNTTGMFGVVFENLKALPENMADLCAVKYILQNILGLTLIPLPEKEVEITPEIQKLLDERAQARAAKDWARADALRDALTKLGYNVQDKK